MTDSVGPVGGGPGDSDDRIIQTDLRNEMSRSYLEYAMSVIVGRALPTITLIAYSRYERDISFLRSVWMIRSSESPGPPLPGPTESAIQDL